MRATGPFHAARHAGFSLIELLTVVVILVAVAGMAIPRYAGALARYHLDAAVQRIENDLALAQQSARTTSTSCTVTFDTAGELYTIFGVTDLDDPTNPNSITRLSDPPYEADLVSANFGGDATVVFDGYGAPDSGGIIVVRVGAYSRQLTIDINIGKITAVDL